jgi:hypothetical protein
VASNLVLPDAPESIVDLVQDIAVLSNQIKQEELL